MPLTPEQYKSICDDYPELGKSLNVQLEDVLSRYYKHNDIENKDDLLLNRKFTRAENRLLKHMIVSRHLFSNGKVVIKKIGDKTLSEQGQDVIVSGFSMMENSLLGISGKKATAFNILKNIGSKFIDSLFKSIPTNEDKEKTIKFFSYSFHLALATQFFEEKDADIKKYQKACKVFSVFLDKLSKTDILSAVVDLDSIINATINGKNITNKTFKECRGIQIPDFYSSGRNICAFYYQQNKIALKPVQEAQANIIIDVKNNITEGFANAQSEIKTFRPFSS